MMQLENLGFQDIDGLSNLSALDAPFEKSVMRSSRHVDIIACIIDSDGTHLYSFIIEMRYSDSKMFRTTRIS